MNRLLFCIVALLLWPESIAALGAPAPSNDGAWADRYCLLCVDRVDLRYQKFRPDGRRDPYAPDWDGHWDYRVGLNWDLNLLHWGFWDNDLHTEALQTGQVKTVGWHWRLGFRIPPLRAEVYHEHHSQHVMDQAPSRCRSSRLIEDAPCEGDGRKFPVEDSYGIKVNLYRGPRVR